MKRVAAALALAGVAGAVSYALQTLYASLGAPPDFAVPIATAPIPFYWRIGLTLFHGIGVGTLAFLGLPEAVSARILEHIPLLAPAIILPLAGLMLVIS